jgi:hypothetical protein
MNNSCWQNRYKRFVAWGMSKATKAKEGTWPRRLQGWVKPIWKILFDGCHPDRETVLALKNAGFKHIYYQHFQGAIPIVRPHIAGFAIK